MSKCTELQRGKEIFAEDGEGRFRRRFLRIETWIGDRRKAIIIPGIDYNKGWGELARKILHFLGEASNSKYKTFTDLHNRSFLEAAQIPKWPPEVEGNTTEGANNYFKKCLFGYFNDPFHSSPNPEIIQKWFLTCWQVTAGLRITPIAHNKFLFELPSTQEASRVLAGD